MSHTTDPKVVGAVADRANLLPGQAVRAAVGLGLPRLAREWRDVVDIAEEIGGSVAGVDALCRYLVSIGLLQRDHDLVRLTVPGTVLLDDHPAGLARHWHPHSVASRMDRAFDRIAESVRTGRPAYELTHGTSLYDDVDGDDGAIDQVFDTAADVVAHAASALATWLDIPHGAHVVDVGSGLGLHLHAILDAHADATATAVDLPSTSARAHARRHSQETASRIQAVGADFTRDPIPGGDVLLLSNVLVDLDGDAAVDLLVGCRSALVDRGRIVVIELDRDLCDPGLAAHMGLHQFCMTGGRLRSRDELEALFLDADLAESDSCHLGAGVTVVVLRPVAEGTAAGPPAT